MDEFLDKNSNFSMTNSDSMHFFRFKAIIVYNCKGVRLMDLLWWLIIAGVVFFCLRKKIRSCLSGLEGPN